MLQDKLKGTAFRAVPFNAEHQRKAGFLRHGCSYGAGGAFCVSGTDKGVLWMVTGVPTLVCL